MFEKLYNAGRKIKVFVTNPKALPIKDLSKYKFVVIGERNSGRKEYIKQVVENSDILMTHGLEGLGIAHLEAMYCGAPVISDESYGAYRYLLGPEYPWLSDKTKDQIAMLDILLKDSSKRFQWGQFCRYKVEELTDAYKIATNVRETIDIELEKVWSKFRYEEDTIANIVDVTKSLPDVFSKRQFVDKCKEILGIEILNGRFGNFQKIRVYLLKNGYRDVVEKSESVFEKIK
jgi:hypothetical protein